MPPHPQYLNRPPSTAASPTCLAQTPPVGLRRDQAEMKTSLSEREGRPPAGAVSATLDRASLAASRPCVDALDRHASDRVADVSLMPRSDRGQPRRRKGDGRQVVRAVHVWLRNISAADGFQTKQIKSPRARPERWLPAFSFLFEVIATLLY
jgi:hypothetical protein